METSFAIYSQIKPNTLNRLKSCSTILKSRIPDLSINIELILLEFDEQTKEFTENEMSLTVVGQDKRFYFTQLN